jgi:hypothetical protein
LWNKRPGDAEIVFSVQYLTVKAQSSSELAHEIVQGPDYQQHFGGVLVFEGLLNLPTLLWTGNTPP